MSTNYANAPIQTKEHRTFENRVSPFTPRNKFQAPSAFQKVLLEANGTVTAMLEAYLSEQIKVIKLSESIINKKLDFPSVFLNREEEVISRKVLLQGDKSHRNFIYAESFVLINNLEPKFKDELLKTKTPIGKLWSRNKVETYKEIISSRKEPAKGLAEYFGISPKAELFSRTYSVSSNGKITMIITEKFAESEFFMNSYSGN